MRKVLVVAMAAVFVGSLACAGSLSVTFFNDNGNNAIAGSGGQPNGGTGAATFIRLHNKTGIAKVCTIAYTGQDGTSSGPTGLTTFTLGAGQVLAFRPSADDPAEGAAGQAVPNTDAGKTNGSALVTWSGLDSDIDGVVTTIVVQGNRYGYSLHAG
ncbi:MAG: hypothetical protein KJ052_09940 [Candidatus Hydrogenedentes bacterium]|nr:hypothetical protein [Candidatus Hydrogenedentota bacterium]